MKRTQCFTAAVITWGFGGWNFWPEALSSQPTLAWSKSMGGTDYDVGNNIAVNGGGNVWVAASFDAAAADFDPCPSFNNPGWYGATDIYVAKYNFSNCNCALPVEPMYFTGTHPGNSTSGTESNLLQWATASENGNDYFEVQRAIADGGGNSTMPDGQADMQWESIGKVKGAGKSSGISYYKFIDQHETRSSAPYYYRLKQVDYDGRPGYSDVIRIASGGQGDAGIAGI